MGQDGELQVSAEGCDLGVLTVDGVNQLKEAPVYGDVNGDGKVGAKDLTVLARHISKIEKITDSTLLKNADVTHDDKVNAKDLTKLAKYVSKIIRTLD